MLRADLYSYCIVCGDLYTRDEANETVDQFLNRKTCAHECAVQLRINTKNSIRISKASSIVKVCLVCGKPLSIRDGEKLSKYIRRNTCNRYCSIKIAQESRRKAVI